MLPDYDTCLKHIQAFIKRVKPPPAGTVTYKAFWRYKQMLESSGTSLLDPMYVNDTADKLRKFLIYYSMTQTGVAGEKDISQLLQNVRPYYEKLREIKLGDMKIQNYRDALECLYKGLDGITNRRECPKGCISTITGKSKALMAIWGETPGFDRDTRKRFLKWTHMPEPLVLPALRRGNRWYQPSEFSDIIIELDKWVAKWPYANSGRLFPNCFSNLCSGLPSGRIIDMIYNWKMDDPRVV